MIVDSNAAAPLKYTDPTFQTLLFVRANIYDTSGGSPALSSTVNLALINNGCYWGKFTYTAGKTYLVQKLVYTDGTYTAVDQTYAQDNDDVQCIDLKIANLDAAVSTRAVESTVAKQTQLLLIPANPLLTNDARLNHLDADISSRLAAVGYTAPNNAGIAAIEANTNNLPSDPASESSVEAAINILGTQGAAIKAKTDNLPADPASNTQVNTRLAASSYVAPDNADIISIKAVTDQFTFTGSEVNAHTAGGGGGPVVVVSGLPNIVGTVAVLQEVIGTIQEEPNIST